MSSQVLHATRDIMEDLVSTSQKKFYSLKAKNTRLNMINKILEYYNITDENINEVYALLEKKKRKERFQELHTAYPELFTKFNTFNLINSNLMSYLTFKIKEANKTNPEPSTEPEPATEPKPHKLLHVTSKICETIPSPIVSVIREDDSIGSTMIDACVQTDSEYQEEQNETASKLIKTLAVFALGISYFTFTLGISYLIKN